MENLVSGVREYMYQLAGWIITGGIRVIIILLLTVVGLKIATLLSSKLIHRWGKGTDIEAEKRRNTLESIVSLVMRIVVISLSVLLILGEFGIELGPLIATAGVLGLAVGFGSQELVKDVISGFFILLEDQLRVGDIVELGDKSGVVERVTLRMVVLRDVAGNVHFIRSGHISVVTNMTKDFSRYVFDIGVNYSTDVDHAIRVIKMVDSELRQDDAFKNDIMSEVELFGLDKFGDSALVIKARIQTLPGRQWVVGREFNRRLKIAFDREGIDIPFPHRTLFIKDMSKLNS